MQAQGRTAIPNVGVGSLIVRGDELLLMKRRGVIGNQSWSTPGGYLEFGEAPAFCAQREAAEEVGYEGGLFSFLAITNDVFETRHFVTVWMLSEAPPAWRVGAVSEEVAETGWFHWKSLPQPLFIPFGNLTKGISAPETAFTEFFER